MPLNQQQANKLKKLAATGSISLAIILSLLKAIAVLSTGSLAVLSSMVDSLSDIVASVITFFAVKISVRPASDDYRYGYGKAEAISALFQAAFIAVSGFFILIDAIIRLQHPITLSQTGLGLIIMIISLLSTLILVAFQRWVAKKTNSQAIFADSLHYSIDIMTNSSIILSLIAINLWGITWLDSVIAVAISFYLLHSAYCVAHDAVCLLLDKELPEEIRQNIYTIIASHPLHLNAHDLRTRDIGGKYIFEFHLELDGNLDLYTAHCYSDEVENLLQQKYPDAQIIIHQDPKGIKEDRLDNKLTYTKKRKT